MRRVFVRHMTKVMEILLAASVLKQKRLNVKITFNIQMLRLIELPGLVAQTFHTQ